MKIKFTIITVLLNFILLGSSCHAAVTTTAFPAASADNTHKMIHPDANIVYLGPEVCMSGQAPRCFFNHINRQAAS